MANPNLTQLEKMKGSLSPGEYSEYAKQNTGIMTPLEKMKGNLSPEEFSKFQNTQGIKAMGDALPTQSNTMLNNPAMNARIQGAMTAAPYTGPGQYARSPMPSVGLGETQPLTGVGPIANGTKPLPTAFEAASARMPYSPGSVASEPFNFNSLSQGSQSRINNAIGAVSYEGTPLAYNAENAAAVRQAVAPAAEAGAGAGAGGGYLNSMKNSVVNAAKNPMGALKAAGNYAVQHPYEIAKGAARGVGGLAIGVANQLAPRFDESSYLGQAGNNLRDTAANIGGGMVAGGPLGGVIGGAIDIGKNAYTAGKEALDTYNYGKQSQAAIADSNRTMAARPVPLPASLSVTPNADIMNGVQTPNPTAQSQITPLNGISNGMPVAPGIVNNPAPVGQPAVAPVAPTAPHTPGAISRSGADWDSQFKKNTATRYNSGSDMDRLNMQRLQSGQSTLDARQYRQYRNDGGDRTPQVQAAAPQAGVSSIPPRSEDQTDSERRAQLGKSMGLNGPYKGSMIDGMPSKPNTSGR